jgi:CRP-like cAMP-binding protein
MAITSEQLKRIPIFADLDNRELKAVGSALRERTFDAGKSVTEEGGSGVGFFVIEDGTATVTVGGNEVRKLGPGDYFGEIALLTDTPRSATIVADTDLKCHGLTRWDFIPIVEKHSSIAVKLLQVVAQRLAEAQSAN